MLKKKKYYAGDQGGMRGKILQTLHNSGEVGHSEGAVTTKRVESQFYWRGMKADVNNWVRECDICQKNKRENVPSPGLLQALPIPSEA